METRPSFNNDLIYYYQCIPTWSKSSNLLFLITKIIFLYTLPLIFMSFAYYQIIQVLWRSNIPGHNCKLYLKTLIRFALKIFLLVLLLFIKTFIVHKS